jgi:DNA-binding response OmpR family regulator
MHLSVSVCSALLVSKDEATIKPLSESMQQLAIATEVCSEVSIAPVLLNRRKFGATIVDFRFGDQARTFLEKVRHSPSNRTSVMFATSDSDAETAVAFIDLTVSET